MSVYEIKYTGGTPTKDQRTVTYNAALLLISATMNEGQRAFMTNNDGLIAIFDLPDIRPSKK